MKIALPLLLLSISAHAAECVTYVGEIRLTGKLVRHTYAEQPNYESIALGDAAASYFFIAPPKPICVTEGKNDDGLEPAEPAVPEIQLVFVDGKLSYRQLRPFLGKEVTCRGSVYHAQTGHHHSAVLLSDAACHPTHHATIPVRKTVPVQ